VVFKRSLKLQRPSDGWQIPFWWFILGAGLLAATNKQIYARQYPERKQFRFLCLFSIYDVDTAPYLLALRDIKHAKFTDNIKRKST
jgi:hypothetical protein